MRKCPKCKGKLEKKKNVKLSIPVPENYGIIEYTPEQLELHKEIQKLITKKYKLMGADECMIVFSRVYSTYALSLLKDEGLIAFQDLKD